MKTKLIYLLLPLLVFLQGCEVVGAIFKTGMGVGIFLVLAILVVVVFVISRIRKK